MAKDGVSANSPERTENLTPPDDSRNLANLPLSNLIREMPTPHTNGWQTAPLAEAPRSAPKVDLQGTPQPDGSPQKIPSRPMEVATSASTPVVASNPEINQTHAPANASFPANRQDSTRVIRLKKPNVRYRSSAGLTSAEVKMRLIALWHQSLVRSKNLGAGRHFRT